MADTGYVYYRGRLTAAERDQILQQVGARLTAVIHHSPNQIHFAAWPALTLGNNGQAFGETLEARWWPQEADRWEMLLLSESAQTNLAGWQASTMDADAPQAIWLWGNHWQSLAGAGQAGTVPEGWVQAEIAADLHYPVAGSGETKPIVQVKSRTYRQQGIVRLTRFMALTAEGG